MLKKNKASHSPCHPRCCPIVPVGAVGTMEAVILNMLLLYAYVRALVALLAWLGWTWAVLLGVLYAHWFAITSVAPWEWEWPWFRELPLWGLAQRYFHVSATGSTEVGPPQGEGELFASYPHGMMSANTIVCGMLYGRRQRWVDHVTVSPWFGRVPLLREACLAAGAMPATRYNIEGALCAGKRVLISPEGVMGIVAGQSRKLDMHLGDNCATYRRNDGFLHLAYRMDVPVRPVFVANEHRTVWGVETFARVQRWMVARTGLCAPNFFLGPFRVPLRAHEGASQVPRYARSVDAFKERFYHELAFLLARHAELSDCSANVKRWIATVTDSTNVDA